MNTKEVTHNNISCQKVHILRTDQRDELHNGERGEKLLVLHQLVLGSFPPIVFSDIKWIHITKRKR